jgi:DNA mismatch endonuclease (patch repair protein)
LSRQSFIYAGLLWSTMVPDPELLEILKRELEANGVGFDLTVEVMGVPVPLAIPELRMAVFIDDCRNGCGCPEHYRRPEANEPWPSITQCMARMEAENHKLAEAGWTILRFWEHDVDRSVEGVVERILQEMERVSDVIEFG